MRLPSALIQRLARKRSGIRSGSFGMPWGSGEAIQGEEENELAYGAVRDLIGSIRDDPSDLSVRTGEYSRRKVVK
jgi:hypothetical protein